VPVKRLAVIGLTCLLSACVSSLADLRQDKADKVGDFPVAAVYLSNCVHRTMKGMDSPYDFHLNARPDNLEFYITATRVSDAITRREVAGIELRFIAHDQKTTSVEMREGVPDGKALAYQAWPLIERCSQQLTARPAPNPTAP
jgi:hypothetical protein